MKLIYREKNPPSPEPTQSKKDSNGLSEEKQANESTEPKDWFFLAIYIIVHSICKL